MRTEGNTRIKCKGSNWETEQEGYQMLAGISNGDKVHAASVSPDIEIKIPPETEKKLIRQSDEIFYPGKAEKKDIKAETVSDEVLDRALELLKAREVLGNLKPG